MKLYAYILPRSQFPVSVMYVHWQMRLQFKYLCLPHNATIENCRVHHKNGDNKLLWIQVTAYGSVCRAEMRFVYHTIYPDFFLLSSRRSITSTRFYIIRRYMEIYKVNALGDRVDVFFFVFSCEKLHVLSDDMEIKTQFAKKYAQ